jgi:hypothetical protein
VGHVKKTCPDLNTGAIVNARYVNAPAKQKGQDLSNVEYYTCHKKVHYSNKCSKRQPGGALGTRQDGKPWCSHHQKNTHSSEGCWHLHPHLKDQGGGRQKGKGKQQSNARSAQAANSGGSDTPSGAQLHEMFAAFMLTQNAASAGPRREDSYSGSVVELKVPVTPMSNTDQYSNSRRCHAVEEPNTSGKGCSSYADPQGTGTAAARWPPVQDAARVLTAGSFDFPPQGGG